MRAMTRLGVLLVLAAACGGGAKSVESAQTTQSAGSGVPDQIPTTAGPDCSVVADKLATVALADTPDRQPGARDLFRTRCTDDTWSDDSRSCFATVETDDEIHGCMSKLSAAQRDKLHAAAPDLAGAHGHGSHGTHGTSAPPPPPPPPDGGTKGTKTPVPDGTRAPKRTTSDPCEGGE